MNQILMHSHTRPRLADLNVLLVDDDPFMLELLGSMLRKLGVSRIGVAADGDRGAAAIAAGRGLDLVVCDINMPGKDGFQVMEAMAAAEFRGAVILLSGMDQRTLRSASLMGRFHHLNVLGVMHKPLSKSDLVAMLAQVHA